MNWEIEGNLCSRAVPCEHLLLMELKIPVYIVLPSRYVPWKGFYRKQTGQQVG